MEYWLINSNRSEVKRFIKNEKSIEGVFEYVFIDSGKIIGVLGKESPVITATISVEIDLAREIYERLLSKGWRKTKLVCWVIDFVYLICFSNIWILELSIELPFICIRKTYESYLN